VGEVVVSTQPSFQVMAAPLMHRRMGFVPTLDGIVFALLTSVLACAGVGACARAREPQHASPPPVAVVDVPDSAGSDPDLDASATAVLAQSDAGGSASPDEPEALDDPAAQVGVGGTRVRGSLDKDVIRRIVRRHLPVMRVCYEQELAKDAKLQAKVAPRFVIGADGRVATVSISHGSGNTALDACLERAIQRMVFPRPKGGGVVVVTYPFVFTPSP